MTVSPQAWLNLCVLALALGLRHGFDADHLATIDGLTRVNTRHRPRLARYCGALFSLGHGMVVVLTALVLATVAQHWQVPTWLASLGAAISIAFLLALGLINVRAVLRASARSIVEPVGLKGRLLAPALAAAGPGLIVLIGALFALSFDTISQAALFALAASQLGGWHPVLALGGLFLLGMLVTDGINGLWIARLVRRADARALAASRLMTLAVGGVSLLVAVLALARLALPRMESWSQGKEGLFGIAVIGVVGAAYLLAMRRRQALQS